VWTWLPFLGALLGFAALVAVGRSAAPTTPAETGQRPRSPAPETAASRVYEPLPRPEHSDDTSSGTGEPHREVIDPLVSVVIPTLNEAENLPHVFGRLPKVVDQLVVVDGGSVDGTTAVARRLRPDAKVISQSGWGKGDALACGFAHTWGDIVVMLDADGSTDPAEIPRFVDALRAGATFAKGSRFIPGGGSEDITVLRRTGNRALSVLVNLLFGTRYTDLCYGYNAFWKDALTELGLDCAGFEVETLMNIRAAKAGLKIVEVPSFEASRRAGESKLNARRDGLRILRTIVNERLAGRRARRFAREPVGARHQAPIERGEP
jgi:glycosyltransferase involved in cell wall biosynthesis